MSEPDLRLFLGFVVAKGWDSEQFTDLPRAEGSPLLPSLGEVGLGRLAGDLGDEPVHVSDPGFPGVLGDDPAQGTIVELDLPFESMILELSRYPVTLGDLDLFVEGIAWDLDDLHAVE